MATLKNSRINDTGNLTLPAGASSARPANPEPRQLRFNTELGRIEQYNNSLGDWFFAGYRGVVATGGNAVYDVDTEGTTYRVHVFTSTGNSTFTVDQGGEVEYLIVAGGGGGGIADDNTGGGGGGGAGGLLQGSTSVTPQTYTVTVGAGGEFDGVSFTGGSPENGDNSVAFGLTAIGGGAGGGRGAPGAGGSGGGAYRNATGGSGTAGQGNDGGSGYDGGGGGGAGAPGENAEGGNGGNGLTSFISGISTFYAGGGGGARDPGQDYGIGGLGGGGGGVDDNEGEPGTPNTGGGGGGGSTDAADRSSSGWKGGNGGSGIVIVRYPLRQANPVETAGKKIQKNLFYEFDFAKPTVFQQGDTVVRDSRLFEQPTSSISGSPQYLDPRTHRSHLSFNPGGGSQRVNTPFLVNEFPINSTYALEVWLKITNYPQPLSSPNQYGNTRIAGFVFGAASYGGLGIEYNGNTSGTVCNVRSYIRTTGGSRSTGSYSMPLNTWTHLVLVRDSGLRLYVDGDLFASTSVASGDYNRIGNAGVMRFPSGGLSSGGTLNYRYLQDSQYAIVRTYKTALTADEVSQSFNADRWRFGV